MLNAVLLEICLLFKWQTLMVSGEVKQDISSPKAHFMCITWVKNTCKKAFSSGHVIEDKYIVLCKISTPHSYSSNKSFSVLISFRWHLINADVYSESSIEAKTNGYWWFCLDLCQAIANFQSLCHVWPGVIWRERISHPICWISVTEDTLSS